jgi:hypothetical protein
MHVPSKYENTIVRWKYAIVKSREMLNMLQIFKRKIVVSGIAEKVASHPSALGGQT